MSLADNERIADRLDPTLIKTNVYKALPNDLLSDPTDCEFGCELDECPFLDIEVYYGYADTDRTFSTRYLVNGEYKRKSTFCNGGPGWEVTSWDYPNAMNAGDVSIIDYNDYLNRFGGIGVLIGILLVVVMINFICNVHNNCCKSKCKRKDKYERVKGKSEYESDSDV